MTDAVNIIALQYHFHTYYPDPHPVCEVGKCVMRMALSYSTTISVCTRDSKNVHCCTNSTCKFAYADLQSGDILCKLTNMIIQRSAGVPDFTPSCSRSTRFNVHRQSDLVLRVVQIITALCTKPIARARLMSHAACNAMRAVICMLWNILGHVSATPRKTIFFTATCMCMMRTGVQPNYILPKIEELGQIVKLKQRANTALSGHEHISFSPKTMTDYTTKLLLSIR